MAGKNKVERGFRILVDNSAGSAQGLTGDLVPGSVQGGGITLDEVELTGVSESVKNFLWGHGNSEITAQFYLNDTATTGAFTVLKAAPYVGTVTLQWGSTGAAPTAGDPEWEGEYVVLSSGAAMSGGAAIINARFLPTGSTAPAWGTVS